MAESVKAQVARLELQIEHLTGALLQQQEQISALERDRKDVWSWLANGKNQR